jgi:hypothetical protein
MLGISRVLPFGERAALALGRGSRLELFVDAAL